MNSDHPESHGDSREKWITIDRLCDAYEASLQEGNVERAPYLAGVPRNWRAELKAELDAIDDAYRDAKETREQTVKVPADEAASRRLPTKGRLAELASLDRDKVWLGRFEIRKRLGTGATGSVWCARDARLARWVALKVPHATRVMSETSAARFQTEARAAAAITHPNVVQVHEVLIEEGLPILIQQWIDGPTLAKYMKDSGPMDFDQAADWMSQIADAVACAHDKGIVHRDLKPANVMLNGDRPMVLDFGLASYPQFSSGLTTEGTVLGTPAYMSPEQAEGAENGNQPSTDIYALGSILYEMLVGTPPFVGKAREVLQANKTAIPTPPRSRRAGVPRDLETIALRCLAKSPSARYRSAAELRDDLQRFQKREPIRARKVSRIENIWSWFRLHPAYALLAAGIPIVALLMLGILASQMRSRQLNERARRLALETRQSNEARQELITHRHMVELSRASHELSQGNRTRGLELLRSIPEYVRRWEWRLLDMSSHSPATNLGAALSKELGSAVVSSLAVSKKHRKIFAVRDDGSIWFWRLPTDALLFDEAKSSDDQSQQGFGEPELLIHTHGQLVSIIASRDGESLAWLDRVGNLTIWDLKENERSQLIELTRAKRANAVAFSPDAKTLVVAGGAPATVNRPADSRSWLYSFAKNDSGEFVESAVMRWDDRSAITSLEFVSDDRFAATRGQLNGAVGSIGVVEMWKTATDSISDGQIIWRGLAMRGLDYDPTGNRLAWCDEGGIAYLKNLNLPTDAPPRQFKASRRSASQVRFSPNGLELVVTGADGEVSRWSVPAPIKTDLKVADKSTADKNAIASEQAASEASPSSSESVTNGSSGPAYETTPAPIRHLRDYRGHENTVRDAIFLSPCVVIRDKSKTPARKVRFCKPLLLTGGDDGRVLRWSNQMHESIQAVVVDERPLVDAYWISSRQIVAASVAPRRAKSTYYRRHAIPPHDLTIDLQRVPYSRALAYQTDIAEVAGDADGPPRYAVCARNIVHVFETGKSAVIATFEIDENNGLLGRSATMIGSRYVVVTVARTVKRTKEAIKLDPAAGRSIRLAKLLLFDLDQPQAAPQELALPDIGNFHRLRLSPDGDRIFGSSDRGMVFEASLRETESQGLAWAVRTPVIWQAHNTDVRDFAFLINQNKLATVGDDGKCVIWDLEPRVERATTPSNNISEAPSTPPAVDVPAAAAGQASLRLLVSSGPVTRVASCPGGNRLVTVDAERVIRIWDTVSGLELVALQPRKEKVVAVEFSPDKQFLMVAEAGSRIEVIRLEN